MLILHCLSVWRDIEGEIPVRLGEALCGWYACGVAQMTTSDFRQANTLWCRMQHQSFSENHSSSLLTRQQSSTRHQFPIFRGYNRHLKCQATLLAAFLPTRWPTSCQRPVFLHFFPTRNHRRKPTQDGRDVLLVMFDLEAPFQGKSTARSLEAVIVSCTIINWLPEKSCSCFNFCFHVILWCYIMLYIYIDV